jgi:hypothetical protein
MPARSSTARRTAATIAIALLVLGPAAYALGTAVHKAPGAKRHAKRSLTISGRLARPLRPGTSGRLDLRLANRRPFAVWVTRLRIRVSVDRRHRRAGCSARRDFAVRQLSRRAHPLRLPARRARRLSRLRVKRLPGVAMRNLRTVNQDACKGAKLRLRYTGTARRARPRR